MYLHVVNFLLLSLSLSLFSLFCIPLLSLHLKNVSYEIIISISATFTKLGKFQREKFRKILIGARKNISALKYRMTSLSLRSPLTHFLPFRISARRTLCVTHEYGKLDASRCSFFSTAN